MTKTSRRMQVGGDVRQATPKKYFQTTNGIVLICNKPLKMQTHEVTGGYLCDNRFLLFVVFGVIFCKLLKLRNEGEMV